MKRLIVLAAVAALVVALPQTHDALAGDSTKVEICHFDGANSPAIHTFAWFYQHEGYPRGVATAYFGRVIEVDESALETHLGHGDLVEFWTPENPGVSFYFDGWDEMLDWAESLEETYLPQGVFPHYFDDTNGVVKNADCAWYTFEVVWE